MTPTDLQIELREISLYSGALDGLIGAQSVAAVEALLEAHGVKNWRLWGRERRLVAAEQLIYNLAAIDAGAVDGLVGPQTLYAREVYEWRKTKVGQNPQTWRDTETRPTLVTPSTSWPSQSDVPWYYGAIGENQVLLQLPFPLRIAWDRKKTITRVSCHEKTAASAERVLIRVADAYDRQARQRHGLDLFGGCLNVRKMRGGSAWSMHSWGIAWDFDPERNQLKWGRDRAYLAKPECEQFWKLWEQEGWLSLGRAKNYDWMHVQAARL